MKPWNKENLMWLAVVGTVALCAFFTMALILNYFKLKGTYWFAVLVMLVPYVYGCYAFIKKYLPKKEDYFPKEDEKK